jgi:hypothetical protein
LEEEMARALSRRASSQVVSVLLVLWLLIGLAAAIQRGYFETSGTNCSKVSTVLVTIVAGPLNYVGLNPKLHCEVPEPSR